MIPEMTYWQSSPSLNTVLLKLLNNDAQPQELSVEMGLAVLALLSSQPHSRGHAAQTIGHESS